jgi:hypothetical protein
VTGILDTDDQDNQTGNLKQRGPTGGQWAISALRPLVTRHANLFVNLLLVSESSFIFFIQKGLKQKL